MGSKALESSVEQATPVLFLARQPIFDVHLKVTAYELLYRKGDQADAGVIDGDHATLDVLTTSFLEMGLTQIVGQHQAYINLSRTFLLDHRRLPPPSKGLVLEVLEDIIVDQELIDALAHLHELGYTIALDDFIYQEHLRPLVELAHIIKIDLRSMSKAEVVSNIAALREYPVKLLAEKIETQEEFDWCKALKFDLYQGYFLCRPKVLKGRRMPSNRAQVLRMLAQLQDPAVDLNEVEKIIAVDATMTLRLMRYISSAALFLPSNIASVRQAVIYTGLSKIKQWASILALSSVSDKPDELMMTCLIRARMCELFSEYQGQGVSDTAFVVGLFSLLDALMDTSLDEVLASLPLADDISDALLKDQCVYADILNNVQAYERADWTALDCLELDENVIAGIYLESIDWASQTMKSL